MLECMHGAYVFTKTIREVDWKIRQYLAKMGSQGHPACFPQPDESPLLHPCTIFAVSRIDFLRARKSHCVCSCVLTFSKERPCSPEGGAACVLPGAWDQGR